MNFLFFFFLTMALPLDSFVLKWWAAAAADLTLGAYQAIYPFVTFLCFLGALPASHVIQVRAVIQGLRCCTKHGENYERTSNLYCSGSDQGTTAHMMMNLRWSFRQTPAALVLSTRATGGAWEVLQCYSLYFIFTFVYISVNWEWCYRRSVCGSTF